LKAAVDWPDFNPNIPLRASGEGRIGLYAIQGDGMSVTALDVYDGFA
jgi:hypothetical protein